MSGADLVQAIRAGAARYAGLPDQASRTMVRAALLHQLDELALRKGPAIVTRRVSAGELASQPVLRGAAVLHLDLVFRSSVSAREVDFTAAHGIVRLAFHPGLPGVPIGVLLAQPTARLVRRRSELFDPDSPALGTSDLVMPYAVAASPGRLGAGAALLRAVIADCSELAVRPRVVTFSPLTGIRARVIRMVDTPEIADPQLRAQLLELLGYSTLPERIAEPASSWLASELGRFAESTDYAVGNFHRAMGAKLVGLTEGADPADSDALWARAYFDYGPA